MAQRTSLVNLFNGVNVSGLCLKEDFKLMLVGVSGVFSLVSETFGSSLQEVEELGGNIWDHEEVQICEHE